MGIVQFNCMILLCHGWFIIFRWFDPIADGTFSNRIHFDWEPILGGIFSIVFSSNVCVLRSMFSVSGVLKVPIFFSIILIVIEKILQIQTRGYARSFNILHRKNKIKRTEKRNGTHWALGMNICQGVSGWWTVLALFQRSDDRRLSFKVERQVESRT